MADPIPMLRGGPTRDRPTLDNVSDNAVQKPAPASRMSDEDPGVGLDNSAQDGAGMSPLRIPGSIPRDETLSLISADKVEGTVVYNTDGHRLGSIDTLMIDKARGTVEYAVLSFGGILGFGSQHYPLPWGQLRYDTALGGYVVALTEAQLREAPSYSPGEPVDLADTAWGERVHSYYGPGLYNPGNGL